MSGLPLEGIRVIDLGMYFAGPMAGRLLADMGADVIKIESVGHMDPWRGPIQTKADPSSNFMARYPAGIPSERPYNRSAGFNLQNRNKYGITLALDMPQGKGIFKKLVKISDVVIENYAARVMTKLGLDYPVLKEINPQIIMISMSCLGRSGPHKDYIALGSTVDCMGGIAYLTGYPDGAPMIQSGLPYGDPLSGVNGALAILAALQYRLRTGKGMYIDFSQVEGLIAISGDAVMDYTMNGRVRERMGNRHLSIAPHGCYRCKGDDKWVAISIPSDAVWQRFCQAVMQPAWFEDARFSDTLGRYRQQDELDRLVEAWTINYDHYEIMHTLQEVDIPAGAVLDAKELVEEPHLKERGIYEMVTHPEAGTHPYIGMYAKLSKTPGRLRMPAPCLGEHNRHILGELLKLSEEEISKLEEEGVIGTAPLPKQQGGAF